MAIILNGPKSLNTNIFSIKDSKAFENLCGAKWSSVSHYFLRPYYLYYFII